jgi:hypothetical protein
VEKKEGMMKEEIGFIHGVPENHDRSWERQVGAQLLVFTRKWDSKCEMFEYGCHTRSGNGNSFQSSLELDIEQMVNNDRFANVRSLSTAAGI